MFKKSPRIIQKYTITSYNIIFIVKPAKLQFFDEKFLFFNNFDFLEI